MTPCPCGCGQPVPPVTSPRGGQNRVFHCVRCRKRAWARANVSQSERFGGTEPAKAEYRNKCSTPTPEAT